MNAEKISQEISQVLESKKGLNVNVMCIKYMCVYADYLVVASGTSSTHVKALAEEVEFKMKEKGILPNRREGFESNLWVLLDYGGVIVHVFSEEARKFYNVEDLWKRSVKL